jgi:AcrR family transcriptional regulator
MGRPPGSRNRGYDTRRDDLAAAVLGVLLTDPARRFSLRELAASVGVSVSTLRHYFDDREGLVIAALEVAGAAAVPALEHAMPGEDTDRDTALIRLLRAIRRAWTEAALGRAHAVGLAEGLHHHAVGPSYAELVLTPMVTATASVLRQLDVTPRPPLPSHATAALCLVSPLFLLLLNHDALGGRQPIAEDVDAFIDGHVASFLRGHVLSAGAA